MRKHQVGDRVKLMNWREHDPHHPQCKGTVTAIRTDLSELDKRHHGTDYYVTVEWDNGRINTFYKPHKHIRIIDNFQIQEDLFEI
jgi:hypothetical protein